ncbi:hypothetical protein ZOSMA_16G00360 [Zostera marina]|uniref:Uncharacterized protein n=1 Tax=Zostera marina TaxID=29655 RepID=A0A0K9PUZ5_ZOSMR|nr:hypothetical protein ZOSMA_16G00360 [Zostera marina]
MVGDCSSSGEDEDGGTEWKKRIQSAASAGDYIVSAPQRSSLDKSSQIISGLGQDADNNNAGLKLYQIKARKFLDEMLEKSLVFVQILDDHLDEISQTTDLGVRLFHKAPLGIIFDPIDINPRPKKRPQLIPREEINEKSKKFKQIIRHSAVDGVDIMTFAKNAMLQSLARYEAKDIAAKKATKKEEERILELKKVRGEKWLPSIAREMKKNQSYQSSIKRRRGEKNVD